LPSPRPITPLSPLQSSHQAGAERICEFEATLIADRHEQISGNARARCPRGLHDPLPRQKSKLANDLGICLDACLCTQRHQGLGQGKAIGAIGWDSPTGQAIHLGLKDR
jgi:hypothetical protein